jgi:hypothetical protein
MTAAGRQAQLSAAASHRLFPLAAGLTALVFYLGTAWWGLRAQAVWSPDEGAKLLQLQSLRVENGRLADDIQYRGRELDPALQYAPVVPAASALLQNRDGRLFFERLPVFPLLVKPLFDWLGFNGLYLWPAVAGAACGLLTLLLLARAQRRLAMWLLVAWGSPVFIYSTLFWEHTLATGLGLGAAALAVWACSRPANLRRNLLAWIGVGLLLGASIYLRLEAALFGVALLIACGCVVRASRPGALVAGGVLLGLLAPYFPLHQAMVGQSLPHNAQYLFYPFRYLARAEWRAVPDLLLGPAQDEALDTGWLGGLWAIAAIVALAHSFEATRPGITRWVQYLALGITAVAAVFFLFTPAAYRSAHGLLFTTPWAIVGLCRAREIWQRGDWRARIVVLTVIIGLAGYVVGVAGLRAAGPHGGLEWGARFAMTFYPLLAILTAWDWPAAQAKFGLRLLTGILVVLGVGFQLRGLQTIGHDKQVSAKLHQALLAAPEAEVLSDLWWLPLDAAPLAEQKSFFVALTPDQMGHWMETATAHHVQSFVIVTLKADLLDALPPSPSFSLRLLEVRQVEHLLIWRLALQPS